MDVSQPMDLQTYKKFVIIGKNCTNISGISSKKSECYLFQNSIYPYIDLISIGYKPPSRHTRNLWLLGNSVKNIPGVSLKNQKDISSRTGDIQLLV